MDAERRDPGAVSRVFRYAASPHAKEVAKPEPTLDLEPAHGPDAPGLGTGKEGAAEVERDGADPLVVRVREMQESLTRSLNRAAKAKELDLGRGR